MESGNFNDWEYGRIKDGVIQLSTNEKIPTKLHTLKKTCFFKNYPIAKKKDTLSVIAKTTSLGDITEASFTANIAELKNCQAHLAITVVKKPKIEKLRIIEKH